MPKRVTLNKKEIKDWASKYKGTPELITQKDLDNRIIGLRLDFPGGEDDKFLPDADKIEHLSWEDFFKHFENLSLAFEFEDDDIVDPSSAYRFLRREVLENPE